MLQALLDTVLPTTCAGCEVPLQGGDRLCPQCQGAMPGGLWPVPLAGFQRSWAWAAYGGVLGAALRRGKYRPDPATLAVLGRGLALAAAPLLPYADRVVPVPRSGLALLRTGLEPAGLLAAPVAKAASRQVSRVLRRRHGTPQAALPDDRREDNVAGAFRAVSSVSRCRVLLVDDVVTTGATARACAAALKQAGAAEVVLLACCSPQLAPIRRFPVW